MSIRLNLIVDDEVPAMLTELAGGERKRGERVSELVRAVYESRNKARGGSDLVRIENELAGVAGKLRELEGRLVQMEREMAVLRSRA